MGPDQLLFMGALWGQARRMSVQNIYTHPLFTVLLLHCKASTDKHPNCQNSGKN